jgi:stage II sporulation protein E
MKQVMEQAVERGVRQAAGRLYGAVTGRPVLREAARCALYALGGAALSGAGLAGAPLPLAVCWVAVAPVGWDALAALVGTIVGCAAFWSLPAGLECMAAALLAFACAQIFAPTPYPARPWFAPLSCCCATAAISGAYLLYADLTAATIAALGAKILLAGVGAVGVRRALTDGDRWAQLFLAACAVMGLCAVPLPAGMTLGAVVGAMLAICAAGTPVGAAVGGLIGLSLELAGTGGAATAAFLLGGVLCLVFRVQAGARRAALFTSSVTVGALIAGGNLTGLVPATALGAVLSLPLPALLLRRPAAAEEAASARARLTEAADALDELHSFLRRQPAQSEPMDAATLFDRTADEICQCCGGYARCWEQNAAQTYQILNAAAPQILARGMALREDFPSAFRCCRLDGFLRTLNSTLDELRLRRLCRARADSARVSATAQYALLASFLRSNVQALRRSDLRPDRFTAEIATAGHSRAGHAVSGDRAVTVRAPGHRLYVLLCDGMGTGTAAAQESRHAVSVLSALLRAGVDAEDAIALLDGACTLRADGSFATVDLLEADLLTGAWTLYKQGAAPSYLRRGRRVEQLGAATVPPGYGAESPGCYPLPTGGEGLLVMVSDGALSHQTAQRLRSWVGGSAAELASCLAADAEPDDDATVIVVRLSRR